MTKQTTLKRGTPASAFAKEVPMASSLSLVSLAEKMGLDPVSAIALPAVVTSASRKAGMAESSLIWECGRNAELRDYLAGICRDADVIGALS